MDILYEFDAVGITYTAVVGGLFLLLFLATIMFAARKRQAGAATVLYRVLDILLLVVLLAVWFVYLIGKVELFGLSVKADGTALAFVSDAKTLFSIPYIGGLYGIFDTVLGTVLLGLLSLIAVLSLVFAFALRRGNKAADAVEIVAEPAEAAAYAFDDEREAATFEKTPAASPAAADEPAEPAPAVVSDTVAEPEPADDVASADAPVADAADTPPVMPIFAQADFAAEIAADEADAIPSLSEEKADEVLVDVEVLDDEDEVLVPVEVLPEEPSFAAKDDSPELSDVVKDAIKTVVIETPQSVKDALKVVLGEDAFIVKEVLRVILETPTCAEEETAPVTAVYETADAPAETEIEAVVAGSAPDTEPLFIVPEATDDAVLADAAVLTDDAVLTDAVQTAIGNAEAVIEAAEATLAAATPAEATTMETDVFAEDKGQESVALIRISTQPAHKTYSSSLRRPDMKKKNTAAAAK